MNKPVYNADTDKYYDEDEAFVCTDAQKKDPLRDRIFVYLEISPEDPVHYNQIDDGTRAYSKNPDKNKSRT